ncbi:hypothetical protein [Fusobacterium varium]|jgi:hypothetical protein|nr:hypothetical protein [Fusobacterium varium]DAR56504.1 MAG TPA: hypothetical protein [Caudoviricetes sp.]
MLPSVYLSLPENERAFVDACILEKVEQEKKEEKKSKRNRKKR